MEDKKKKSTATNNKKAKILEKGSKAPPFTLLNQDGEKVSLKDYLGKKVVILYFYPKAMTSGCTVQACGMRDSEKKLAKLNCVVLGVAPDLPAKLLKFREKENLNFDLLSDPDHKVAEAYKSWGKKKLYGREYMGILRQTYVIGLDGKIQHAMDKVTTKTHHDDILEIIQGL